MLVLVLVTEIGGTEPQPGELAAPQSVSFQAALHTIEKKFLRILAASSIRFLKRS